MAFCTKCGASIDGQFCTRCGTPVSVAGTAGAQPQSSSSVPPIPPPIPPPVTQSPTTPVSIPPKKHGPLLWILVGCLGLIVIAGIIAVSCGLFVVNKVRQAGFDPALMEKNPGLAVAKLLASVNPNIEVLSVDEDRGIIRVRDKKTGKSLTMNLADAKNGKIVFQNDDNQNVEIQTRGEGDSTSIQMRGPDGSMSIGAGAIPLPDWLPAYPGAKSNGAIGFNANNGKSGSETFETGDSVEQVASFYESVLKRTGMEVQKTAIQNSNQGSMIILSAKTPDETRTGGVSVASNEGKTVVTLSFETK